MLRKVSIVFVILGTLLSANGAESRHFIELQKHRNIKPPVIHGEPSSLPASLSARFSPVTEKLIFGYLPYWNNSTLHLRWGLLTDLLYFSCEMEPGGTLGNCNGWPQGAPIDEAREYGVRIHLVITGFNKNDILALLQNATQKNTFFNAVWNKVKENQADGINIDFESFGEVSPRSLLTDFFNELAQYMKSKKSDMIISAAIPAVDWSDNWDLAGMTNVDYFFMMLYDYHWKGGEPGPVAPLLSNSPWLSSGRSVTRSIDDYVDSNGVAIKKKLIAGYPYYGLKWKTTDDSIPGTRVENAVSVIYDKVYSDYSGIVSSWDDGSDTPCKIWEEGSTWYQLWYDDAESLGLKFDLANSEDLAGSGMWALNYDISRDDLWKELAYHFVNDKSGSFSDPVVVEKFPFIYEGNTFRYVSYEMDSYECFSSPDHSGPETVFELTLEESGRLIAEITEGYGEDSLREEHSIILLSHPDKNCMEGNCCQIDRYLSSGKYFISVDSVVLENITKGGPFTVEMNFEPEENDDEYSDEENSENDDQDQENNDDDDTKENDDDPFGENGDEDFDHCEYEGEIYEHDEIFEKGDGCNLCHCYNGSVVCSEKQCIPENKKGSGCSVTVL